MTKMTTTSPNILTSFSLFFLILMEADLDMIILACLSFSYLKEFEDSSSETKTKAIRKEFLENFISTYLDR